MNKFITRYNLKDFQQLIPLLMRCFPEFWTPRLAEKKYSFPYDLKLFAARLEGKLMGCIGVHPYPFFFEGDVYSCGGVCDVAIDPDYRGKGYSVELQKFFMDYCQRNYKAVSLMPLYTGKPGVYLKRGWKIYESDRSDEISSEVFPPENTFTFNAERLSLACLRGRKAPRTQEELLAHRIMKLYLSGKKFNGKCIRSGKTWWELFADAKHLWRLTEDTYYLYRAETLLEAYSSNPVSPVNRFAPRHGGFEEDNKVMVNLPRLNTRTDGRIARALEEKSFIFPAADIF